MAKKKFKDTKAAGWIKENAPDLLHSVLDFGDNFFPPLELLTNLVKREPDLTVEQKTEFEKLAIDTYRFELNYDLQQSEGSRSMYGAPSKEMADWIARRIMGYNVWIILFLVVLNVTLTFYIENALLAVVSNIIGIVMGQLIAERQTVVQFFLGSSIGSKLKDVFKGGT